MDTQQLHLFKKYIDIVFRMKKLIIFILYLSIASGLTVYLLTPKLYQSTALIMYQQSSINPSKMSPDESRQLMQMIRTMSEQVLSRTNLEDIINRFNLYQDLRESLPIEDVISLMREKKITIDSSRESDIFKVSFQGETPQSVMRVANAIAAKFIEENLRVREEKVTETKAYVKDELELAKNTLDKKEIVMRDYKLKYYNEMPDKLQSNIAMVNAIQAQYQSNQQTTQSLEQTRLLVLEQVGNTKERLNEYTKHKEKIDIGAGMTDQANSGYQDLTQLKAMLDALLSKYTPEHPDVKRVKKQIEQFQETKNEETGSVVAEKPNPNQKIISVYNSDLEKLSLQLKEIEMNLSSLKDERKAIGQQIEQYQKWIEAAPIREAEWTALTRDYEELKKHYEDLVAKNLAADAAASLERKQKGSQFKIIDSALIPEKPFKPDFFNIMLIALGIGLGGGVGLAILLDFLDTTFKEVIDIESFIGVPVICSIPIVPTQSELAGEKRKFWLWSTIFFVSTVSLCGGFAYFWNKGLIVL